MRGEGLQFGRLTGFDPRRAVCNIKNIVRKYLSDIRGGSALFIGHLVEKRLSGSEKESFDVIIVGAGSAGCVLADRLTGDGRASVLLLEYGGSDRSPIIQMPGALTFDRWEEEGATRWGYGHVLPYFRRAESRRDGADSYRGGEGPLATRYGLTENPLYNVFVEADAKPAMD
jgi:choline dehydrogenase-like flavoprotein